MSMKTFAEQMFWSFIYVTAPLGVLYAGSKWSSLFEADFTFLLTPWN